MGKGMQVLVGWKWVVYGFLSGLAVGFTLGVLRNWIWNFFAGL